MSFFRHLLMLLGLLATTAQTRAQVIVVPNPYLVPTSGTRIFYSYHSRHTRLAVSLGGYSYGYWSPYYTAPGYSNFTSVTVVYSPPPLVGPLNPAFLGPQAAQPFGVGGFNGNLRLDDLGRLDPSLSADPTPLRKVERQPLPRPKPVERQQLPQPADVPRKDAVPPMQFDPAAVLPKPAAPDADPKIEAVRQLRLGRDAFAVQEYGRAAEFFRQAAKGNAADAHFLLAQALFAAGRYDDAVDAIRSGIALKPDWPKTHLAPRDLYGAKAAEFTDHLRRLRDTLERLPNDPVLLFLSAYELWLDGKHDEARPLFRKARPGFADPAIIDRFLGA